MLKHIFQHRLFKNTSALLIVQLMTYVAPLLALPYLSRTLGVDGFGQVTIALSLCMLANVITDFGFNLSATYMISRKQTNHSYISKIISIIYCSKIVIILLISPPIITFTSYRLFSPLAIIAILLAIFFQSFQSIWFFQGIEKMKNISYITIVTRFSYVALIFLYVKEPTHYDLVLAIYAFSLFLGSITSNILIIKENIRPVKFSYKFFKTVISHSSQFFLSRLAVATTTSISTLMVGSTGSYQTGLYSIGERCLTAFRGLLNPINQALYPYMTNSKDPRLLFKIIAGATTISIIPFIILFIYSQEFIVFIFGSDYSEANNIFRILMFVGLLSIYNTFMGYPAFAAIKKVYLANRSIIVGGCFQIVFLLLLYASGSISGITIAISILIVDIFILLLRIYYFFTNYLQLK